MSKEWTKLMTEAAIETAEYVVHHINELAGTNDGQAGDRGKKLREFWPQVHRASCSAARSSPRR